MKVCRIITDVILVVLVILAAIIYVPKICNIQTYKVLSASMEPNYKVGSLIYVKKCTQDNIKEGDVITFYINENTLVTHRVVKINDETNGYITKGDANQIEDGGEVSFDNVIGKVVLDIAYLGYVSDFMNSIYGKCFLTAMFIIMIIMEQLPRALKRVNMETESRYE